MFQNNNYWKVSQESKCTTSITTACMYTTVNKECMHAHSTPTTLQLCYYNHTGMLHYRGWSGLRGTIRHAHWFIAKLMINFALNLSEMPLFRILPEFKYFAFMSIKKKIFPVLSKQPKYEEKHSNRWDP